MTVRDQSIDARVSKVNGRLSVAPAPGTRPTIVKIVESILKFQRAFFDKGIVHLKPLTLRDVADDIGVHEATVSRATTKTVATPQGAFALKYFFNAGLSRVRGEDIASPAVRAKIKALIDGEDPAKPYSDSQIVKMLAKVGVVIARRTVVKFREQLGIPSSRERRTSAPA